MGKPKRKTPLLAHTGKRVGAFSTEERQFILDNLDKTDEYIAEKLLRNVLGVTKERHKLVVKKALKPKIDEEITEEKEAMAILHRKPTWNQIKKNWTESEIKVAEYHWRKLYKQFRGDMLHSEESQVFKLIELEILMNRSGQEKKKLMDEIEELTQLLNQAREEKDRGKITDMASAIAAVRQNRAALDKTHNDYLGRHKELLRELKGTREQRIKQIEEGKKTFFDWLKALADDEYRQGEAKRAELFVIAMQKEKKRLSEYHKFGDGKVDQPILSCDTIRDDNMEELKEEEIPSNE